MYSHFNIVFQPTLFGKAQQQEWKIPPVVSNWKNAKGYIISLDKRLAVDDKMADGEVNDNFAKLSEALFVAERNAREEVSRRSEIQKALPGKGEPAKTSKESALLELAEQKRDQRATTLGPTYPPNNQTDQLFDFVDSLPSKNRKKSVSDHRSKSKQSSSLATGEDINANLNQFAQRRTDIFGEIKAGIKLKKETQPPPAKPVPAIDSGINVSAILQRQATIVEDDEGDDDGWADDDWDDGGGGGWGGGGSRQHTPVAPTERAKMDESKSTAKAPLPLPKKPPAAPLAPLQVTNKPTSGRYSPHAPPEEKKMALKEIPKGKGKDARAASTRETISAKDEVTITGPTNFRRDMHVGFDQSTGQFDGVPQEWKAMLSASGISKSEIVSDPSAVLEVLQFASKLQQQQSLEGQHHPLPPPPPPASAPPPPSGPPPSLPRPPPPGAPEDSRSQLLSSIHGFDRHRKLVKANTVDRSAPLQATAQHAQSLEDRPLPALPPVGSSDAPPRPPRGGKAQPPASRNAFRLSGASRPTSTVTNGASRFASYSENLEESLDQSLYSRMLTVLRPTPQSDEPTNGMEWV